MKIAIVGAGVAGSSILKTIIEHNNFSKISQIYIFDKRTFYGAGMPHEPDSENRKLNVKSSLMSIDPNDSLNLIKWLNKNDIPIENEENLTSRNDYGKYLHDYFSKYYENDKVKFVPYFIEDINILNDKYELIDSNKNNYIFDAVFLSIGRPNYQDPYNLDGISNYIQDPYPFNDKFKVVDNSKKIGVIGAGSTSMDIFRMLNNDFELENPIYFLTRKSTFKLPNISYIDDVEIKKFSVDHTWVDQNVDKYGFLSLKKIIEQFKSDFSYENIDFKKTYKRIDFTNLETHKNLYDDMDYDIRYIISYLKKFYPMYARVFGLLNKNDKEEFLNKYHKMINKFIGLNPPKSLQILLNEYEKGKVKIIKNLSDIKYDGNRFLVDADEKLEFDVIINSTGFDFNLKNNAKTNILIYNLLNKEIIQPQENGKHILIKWPESNVLSRRYGQLNNFYVLGLFVYGSHYRNNDALSMNSMGMLVANDFMKNI